MDGILKLLSGSEAGDIFLWLGGLLLLLGFVGRLGPLIEMPPKRRNLALVAGVVLLAAGVLLEKDMLPKATDSTDTAGASSVPAVVEGQRPVELDWIIVIGSHASEELAKSQRADILASVPQTANLDRGQFHVIATSDYSGLRDGYWAVVMQADNQAQARRRLTRLESMAPGAYVKRAGA